MHQGIESIRKGKLPMAKEIKRGSERELGLKASQRTSEEVKRSRRVRGTNSQQYTTIKMEILELMWIK